MLRDIICVLVSQGWQKAVDEDEDLGAIDRIAEKKQTRELVKSILNLNVCCSMLPNTSLCLQ